MLSFLLALATLPLPALAQNPDRVAVEEVFRNHNFFARRRFNCDETGAPFLLFVQQPEEAQASYQTAAVRVFAPWLGKISEVFERDYRAPLGLERRADSTPYTAVVVSASAHFQNAFRYRRRGGLFEQTAFTIENPRCVVTLREQGTQASAREQRVPLLHEAVLELLLSHYQGETQPPQMGWFWHGFAAYLATQDGDVSNLDQPQVPAELVEKLSAWAEDSNLWEANVLNVDDLLYAENEGLMNRVVRSKHVQAKLEVPLQPEQAFVDQALLFLHFLHSGVGGKYRDGVGVYLAATMGGAGGPRELERATGVAIPTLNEEYEEYLELIVTGASTDGLQSGLSALSSELQNATSPDLFVVPEARDEWLAVALGHAVSGDYETALALLQNAGLQGADGERIVTEIERIETLKAARDAFLASIVGTTTRVKIPYEGKSLPVTVTAIDGSELTLGKNKRDLASWSAREIDPSALATAMTRKIADFGPEWVLAYAHLLGGNKRYTRHLGEGPEGQAIADQAGEIEGLLELGRSARALSELAQLPTPTDASQVEQATEAIKALLADFGELETVRSKRPALRELAQRVFKVAFELDGMSALASVPLAETSQGRVRLKYTFDKASELNDFTKVEGYLPQRRADGIQVKKSESESEFIVKGGSLQGDGAVCYRHNLSFEAPVTLRYQVVYGRPRPGGALGSFQTGVCDDGNGNYVGAVDIFHLEAIDLPRSYVKLAYAESVVPIEPAKTFNIELHHDGKRATLTVDGKLVREIDVGPRQAGSVFLWAQSQILIAVKQLEIEGKLSKSILDDARPGWIEARVQDLGL